MKNSRTFTLAIVAAAIGISTSAQADCGSLPDHAALAKALKEAVKPSGGPSNGGFDLNMWGSIDKCAHL